MSNEFNEEKVQKIFDMSDGMLLALVEKGLSDRDIEIAYELPKKVRRALEHIAYDIVVQGCKILNDTTTERINLIEEVEILRKRWSLNGN